MLSSSTSAPTQAASLPPAPPAARRRLLLPRAGLRGRWERFWREGLPAIWASAAMLLCMVTMLVTILVLTLVRGLGQFWAQPLLRLESTSGPFLGTVQSTEAPPAGVAGERVQLRIGNRDLYGLDFRWFEPGDIRARSYPADGLVIEREENGNFHGFLRALQLGERVLSGEDAWKALPGEVRAARRLHRRLQDLDRLEGQDAQRLEERERLARDLASRVARLEDAGGREKTLPLEQIVRAYRPNAMGAAAKSRLYVARLWEFVSAQPRESNTEGGIMPALFGTVLMVLLMTVAVVPLGVVAALYLHEYARSGPLLRAVRLAVGNLAGVPSIVFGMFGLAFFVYGLGGSIDRLFFASTLPAPTFGTGGILWAALTLALLTLPVVVVATEEGLSAVPRATREASLALGATRWQTLWHVVLPQTVPGILTGVILAISRAAGEVAPLMLTGVVKLAPSLALDGSAPFVHLERKFMHLGFHIYDVSMQSPNVEAAKPMVYSTTLLLLLLVVALNASAIMVRTRMRRRYRGAVL
ncbi:MAG TPA: phosphate ABC transporter permease PstA [Candidatus Krumholzibacteria bacterium]|nr:phosphate ABC transporter permease PstA [Candidatus Krumholzibacteria bacterium]